MKIKTALFTFVLAMALILPAFAQITSTPDSIPKPEMQQQDMLNNLGRPTFDVTSGDLQFSVWIITQEEHKKMMAGISEGMEKEMDMKNMGMKKDSTFTKDNGMDKEMENMKDHDKGMGHDMDMKDMGMKHDTSYMKDKRIDKDMSMKEMGMKKDTSYMKDKRKRMDDETIEAMMAGTHHIMVIVKNTASGIETNATSAKVEIVSPTNKNSSVELEMPMMNHFGSGITLDEKGDYLILVNVLEGTVTETIKLKYTIM